MHILLPFNKRPLIHNTEKNLGLFRFFSIAASIKISDGGGGGGLFFCMIYVAYRYLSGVFQKPFIFVSYASSNTVIFQNHHHLDLSFFHMCKSLESVGFGLIKRPIKR